MVSMALSPTAGAFIRGLADTQGDSHVVTEMEAR